MKRRRAILRVEVDCDLIPGAFHTPEYWREFLEKELYAMAPHYKPNVELLPAPTPTTEKDTK